MIWNLIGSIGGKIVYWVCYTSSIIFFEFIGNLLTRASNHVTILAHIDGVQHEF